MTIIESLPAFATQPWFIGGAVVVVLAIIGVAVWWLHKEGKLKLPF